MAYLQRPIRSRRPSVGLAASVALVLAVAAVATAATAQAASSPVNVFPIPGGRVAAPSTQITFRGVPASQLGAISVTGSRSGTHTGRIVGDSDGDGASFIPGTSFKAGETVTVRTSLNIVGGIGGTYSFSIAQSAQRASPGFYVRPVPRVRNDVTRFVSRPDLVPAAVTVTKKASPSVAAGGDLFIAPQYGPAQNGPMIIGPFGGLIWYEPVPPSDTATDLNVQTYQGKPVLTWWQGNVSFAGTGNGEDEIYNTSYQHVAIVKAANGLNADLHEFTITGRDTALYHRVLPGLHWTTSSAKGAKPRIVLDGVDARRSTSPPGSSCSSGTASTTSRSA